MTELTKQTDQTKKVDANTNKLDQTNKQTQTNRVSNYLYPNKNPYTRAHSILSNNLCANKHRMNKQIENQQTNKQTN